MTKIYLKHTNKYTSSSTIVSFFEMYWIFVNRGHRSKEIETSFREIWTKKVKNF